MEGLGKDGIASPVSPGSVSLELSKQEGVTFSNMSLFPQIRGPLWGALVTIFGKFHFAATSSTSVLQPRRNKTFELFFITTK